MSKEPTGVQVKELWGLVGFRLERIYPNETPFYVLYEPNKEQYNLWEGHYRGDELPVYTLYPDIDLNNLFKWAVPKIIKSADYSVIITQDLARCTAYVRPLQGGGQFDAVDDNPALALFWACYKVLKED